MQITRLSATVLAATGIAIAGLSAPAVAAPQLNNGTWCGAWLANQGITSRPCLTFSGGQVRGYVQFAGAVAAGCSATVALYGPADESVNVPCNNNAGTYFAVRPYGTWYTLVTIYKNGAAITGQASPYATGP